MQENVSNEGTGIDEMGLSKQYIWWNVHFTFDEMYVFAWHDRFPSYRGNVNEQRNGTDFNMRSLIILCK